MRKSLSVFAALGKCDDTAVFSRCYPNFFFVPIFSELRFRLCLDLRLLGVRLFSHFRFCFCFRFCLFLFRVCLSSSPFPWCLVLLRLSLLFLPLSSWCLSVFIFWVCLYLSLPPSPSPSCTSPSFSFISTSVFLVSSVFVSVVSSHLLSVSVFRCRLLFPSPSF